MKRKTLLLIICFASSGSTVSPIFAQDEVDPDHSKPVVPEEFKSEIVYREIDLGVGYVSDDAYKFGRYNGMQTKGAFLYTDIDIEEFYEDGLFSSIRGTNLGLESRYLRLEGGLQGRHKFFLEYDELPNYIDNTVKTPFDIVGSKNLTLPSGFDINTNLNTSLHSFELKTERKRIGVGANFTAKKHWQFGIDFSNETKKGFEATGAAIANGSTMLVGNTTTSLLPEPINSDTNLVNATLRYDGEGGQFDVTYHMSLFNNNNDYLSWQDPFNPASAVGSMSLAPDNEFHQISFMGSYTLPYRSHLTGSLSLGRITQDQDFLPYTVNSALTTVPLPRSSLDGEVWLASTQLKLTSRPITKLRLNAEVSYNERDNQTPANTYNYVVLDSFGGGSVRNRPYSYWNNRIKLDANYRFNAISSLRGGYKFDTMKRTYINAERERTEEGTLFAKWKVKPHTTVDIALYAEASSRDGSDYNPVINENPAMRKYHLADRDRTKVGASIDFMATEKLFLSARADYNQDDYKNSTIGLTEATQPSYTVDFSYQPQSNITTYGYYTYEIIQSSQAGLEVSPTSTTAGWEADFDDIFDTVGVGARMTGLGKWDIGADIVYSQSIGEIEMKDVLNPGTEDQYPDTRSELASIELWTSYNHSKDLVYKLGFRFEDYNVDNWAVDGLQPYNQTSVANTLLLGNTTLDYNVYVVTASASYRY